MSEPEAFAPEAESAAYHPKGERSLAALLVDLADQIRTLFRLEVALFKTELAEKLRRLGFGLTALASGAFFVFSGWIVLLAAAALALATVVRPWLATLIVGLAALLAGALLLYLGKRWLEAGSLVPRRTLNSLRAPDGRFGERR